MICIKFFIKITSLALIFAAMAVPNFLYAAKDGVSRADKKSQQQLIRQVEKSARAAEKQGETKISSDSQSVEGESPFETGDGTFEPVCEIDRVVLKELEANGLKPAKLCSDAVFLRRVYLDLTGTIPSGDEAASFIDSSNFRKRELLVNRLLESDEFNTYWTMKFGDNYRIKAEFPINLWPNAAQAYTRYIYRSFAENVPYDKFVRRMLTSSGSNFRVGEVNFYRAMQSRTPDSIAASVALTFMGMRLEKQSETMRRDMPKFFSRMTYKSTKEWKEEIVFYDPSKRASFDGYLPDGKQVSLSEHDDPRAAFADWLTAKGNPYFSRAIANKIWNWLFGTPIVYPVDDMFADNPVVSQKLLDTLAAEFEKADFDMRKFIKMIVLSRTYQQSSIPQSEPKSTREHFGVYGVRQLDAEILIDILCKITGTSETYMSTTPEPYTMLPNYAGAVSLPDGSITTSFLELFGKSPRDTGLVQEKTLTPSASQRLHLINSTHIRTKIERGPNLRPFYKMGANDMLMPLYLEILSRYPTVREKEIYHDYKLDEKNGEWSKILDAPWALINSEEFINRH